MTSSELPPTDLLLDIEGTTSSISFVHDVLFPYARERLPEFVALHRDQDEVRAVLEGAKTSLTERGWPAATEDEIVQGLLRYIDEDVKDTSLKALQGKIWVSGYMSGAYQAHMYPEVPAALRRWKAAGRRLSIYSSGSIGAQKLFFRYSVAGDLLPLLHTHFDTTTGPKKAAPSYAAILKDLERTAEQVLFLSDVPAELDAAAEVGLRTTQLVRPGTTAGEVHPTAADFDEVERAFGLSLSDPEH